MVGELFRFEEEHNQLTPNLKRRSCRLQYVSIFVDPHESTNGGLDELHNLVHGDGPSVVMTNGLIEEGVLFLSRQAVALVTNVAEQLVDALDVNLSRGGRRSDALEQLLLEAVGGFS